MFGFRRKKRTATLSTASYTPEELFSPVQGTYKPLNLVGDPVFSSGLLGEGYAVEATEKTINAPVSGRIVLIQNTLQACAICTPQGAEVLIHIGVDVAQRNHYGLKALVETGTQITAGEPLLRISREKEYASTPLPEVMVMVTNMKNFGVNITNNDVREVSSGEHIGYTKPR
ncbi:PTS sugar transporter subunit IIA [Rothia sp. P7181]|uniref:PTS sugar transporter subunit IIA n=1 Tax=unclassified Rothia (in: high G+C Gram-positive bacteria) TaxID=2689056 RepID=UPI003AC46DA3